MRHRKGFNHLGRKAPHRKAMLSNMAVSLIMHKRITTTTAKAKALRSYVEPLLTKSKEDTTHSRRVVFSYLQDKEAVSELFREVSPKIADRPGGYTRIIKLPNRLGDNAEMAMIELVDFNELLLSESAAKSTSSRRRRRGGSKKKAEETTTDTAVAETTEAEVSEAPEAAVETEEVVEETADATEVAEAEVVEEKPAESEPEVKAEAEEAPADKEEAKEDISDEEEKKDS